MRCEQQRQELGQHVADIEARLQTTDRIVSAVYTSIHRPQWWLATISGLWFLKRVGVWSVLGRGWLLWSTARQVIRWFKR